jgi:hypothetical protein
MCMNPIPLDEPSRRRPKREVRAQPSPGTVPVALGPGETAPKPSPDAARQPDLDEVKAASRTMFDRPSGGRR